MPGSLYHFLDKFYVLDLCFVLQGASKDKKDSNKTKDNKKSKKTEKSEGKTKSSKSGNKSNNKKKTEL
jgi:hypothetical protein